MATLPDNMYEFKSIYSALDFIRPLLIEGYPVTIQKVYGEQPVLPSMEMEVIGYRVEVGPKGEEVKIYLPNEKADASAIE